MLKSKKDVDDYVRIVFSKIVNEEDRAVCDFTTAMLYFEIEEYASAEHYICEYLRIKDDNDEAHKILGQCYMYQKQPTKALQSFQRSLSLNPKQPEILVEVCQILVDNDQMSYNSSSEWFKILWMVLSKYEQVPNTKKDWEFWFLVAICWERLIYLSFITPGNGSPITETENLLFGFDQYMFKIAQLSDKFRIQRELVTLFLDHYRGQLLLHAVSLIFKRELMQNKIKWRESLQLAMPLLLLAYHTEPKENKESWMKHCDENGSKLIQLWYREGSFRCAQAGRVLLSCINVDNQENARNEINIVFGTQSDSLWSNADELLTQIRQICVDKQWRRKVFSHLFYETNQEAKEQTSWLVQSTAILEPTYDLPSLTTLAVYEEVAQHLRPQSLQNIVYLYLSYENLSGVRAKYFSALNFSTSNLSFCGADSLNQLDVDSYLYASIIACQRSFQLNRKNFEWYKRQRNISNIRWPSILPFVNMLEDLCTEEQCNWWALAYEFNENFAKTDNAAQIPADLQAGIEVVRILNFPKMDIPIAFKLGQICLLRAENALTPVERSFLEARTEIFYLHGLNMLNLHNRNGLKKSRMSFKYRTNSVAAKRELDKIAISANLYLSGCMVKKEQDKALSEETSGVSIPFAENKSILVEANNAKQCCAERFTQCLHQTKDEQTEFFSVKSNQSPQRHLMDSIFSSPQQVSNNTEMGSLDRQIEKDYLVSTVKPDTISLNNEVAEIDNLMKKMHLSSRSPSPDNRSNVLNVLNDKEEIFTKAPGDLFISGKTATTPFSTSILGDGEAKESMSRLCGTESNAQSIFDVAKIGTNTGSTTASLQQSIFGNNNSNNYTSDVELSAKADCLDFPNLSTANNNLDGFKGFTNQRLIFSPFKLANKSANKSITKLSKSTKHKVSDTVKTTRDRNKGIIVNDKTRRIEILCFLILVFIFLIYLFRHFLLPMD